MASLREFLKHSSIYMVGQILTRLASVLLLPLYTHLLTPADYGVTAILDLTAAILSTVIAGGLVIAVTRHHFDEADSEHIDRVWWTGLSMVLLISSVLCAAMWLSRLTLADLTLGPDITRGAWFYTLSIATLCFTVPGMILDGYLRVMKWSGRFVLISLGRLVANIALNVWLMVGLQLGVEGLLIGNLTATVLHTLALFAVYVRSRGGFCFDPQLARQMTRFAAPLVLTSVLTMLIHEADRYFLRVLASMDVVGVYSLAHKIGFAVSTLCLLPFLSVWHVSVYDIEKLPDSRQMFGRFFGWFTSGLGILLLGASLTIHPVLPLLTPDSYGQAADLVSVILLGFYLFGLASMFEVPSLLTRKTALLIPGSVVGVVVNVAANWLLVPLFGAWGAAWAGVLTYLAFSFTILAFCRTQIKLSYPWRRFVLTSLGFCGSYVVIRYGCFPFLGPVAQIGLSVLVCGGWALLLFGREGMNWWRSQAASVADEVRVTPAVRADQNTVICRS